MATKRAYLDTCLVSGLVKEDIDPKQLEAVKELLEMPCAGLVLLACSSVVEDELTRLPKEYAGPHLEVLRQFGNLPKVTVGGITRLGCAALPTSNPKHRLWTSLTACLPDEQDAWHVFVAATNRYSYLVTVDRKTMLSRADAVLAASGVRLVAPLDLVGEVQANAS